MLADPVASMFLCRRNGWYAELPATYCIIKLLCGVRSALDII